MLDVELVFELIPYLTKETSIGPYSIAEGKLTEIDRNLQESHSFVAYRVNTILRLIFLNNISF